MSFVTMTETRCPDCHITFGVPGDFLSTRQEDKRKFWCPNGHIMSYTESTADQLRRERDRLKQSLAQKDDEIAAKARELEAERKKAKRVAKRAAAGVCQCCQRTFTNVALHMKHMHPDFAEAKPPLKLVK